MSVSRGDKKVFCCKDAFFIIIMLYTPSLSLFLAALGVLFLGFLSSFLLIAFSDNPGRQSLLSRVSCRLNLLLATCTFHPAH